MLKIFAPSASALFAQTGDEFYRPDVPLLPGLEKFAVSNNISFLYNLDYFDITIISLYFGILFLLSIYGLYRLRLVYLFFRYRNHPPKVKSQFSELYNYLFSMRCMLSSG
jgi:hypothetical protein